MSDTLSVREIQSEDIERITNYWMNAEDAFLLGMGVDLSKMLKREQWIEMLSQQISQPYTEKKSYCTIWEVNGKAVGHSNVNKIIFGQEAYMHLHMWDSTIRSKGYGMQLVKLSLGYFFKNLKLKTIYCEPYALNPAPNKTLEKLGFRFVKEYITIPGMLNFEQPVNLWELSQESFLKLQ
jgi:RimJ/RimL family protein N-acetyltransferase